MLLQVSNKKKEETWEEESAGNTKAYIEAACFRNLKYCSGDLSDLHILEHLLKECSLYWCNELIMVNVGYRESFSNCRRLVSRISLPIFFISPFSLNQHTVLVLLEVYSTEISNLELLKALILFRCWRIWIKSLLPTGLTLKHPNDDFDHIISFIIFFFQTAIQCFVCISHY